MGTRQSIVAPQGSAITATKSAKLLAIDVHLSKQYPLGHPAKKREHMEAAASPAYHFVTPKGKWTVAGICGVKKPLVVLSEKPGHILGIQ